MAQEPQEPNTLPAKRTQDWSDFFGVLDASASGKLKIPDFHTRAYCDTLAGTTRDACLSDRTTALDFRSGIAAASSKLSSMPVKDLDTVFSKVAHLRDALRLNGSYGNILVANLLNNLIFWRVVERITRSQNTESLAEAEKLIGYYGKFAPNLNLLLPKLRLECGLPKGDLSPETAIPRFLQDLEQKHNKVDVTIFPIDLRVPLNKPKPDLILNLFLGDGGSSDVLKNYLYLRKQVGVFPATQGPAIIDRGKDGSRGISTRAANQFSDWVDKYFSVAARPDLKPLERASMYSDMYLTFSHSIELNSTMRPEVVYRSGF